MTSRVTIGFLGARNRPMKKRINAGHPFIRSMSVVYYAPRERAPSRLVHWRLCGHWVGLGGVGDRAVVNPQRRDNAEDAQQAGEDERVLERHQRRIARLRQAED